jgi:hypothetical protein
VSFVVHPYIWSSSPVLGSSSISTDVTSIARLSAIFTNCTFSGDRALSRTMSGFFYAFHMYCCLHPCICTFFHFCCRLLSYHRRSWCPCGSIRLRCKRARDGLHVHVTRMQAIGGGFAVVVGIYIMNSLGQSSSCSVHFGGIVFQDSVVVLNESRITNCTAESLSGNALGHRMLLVVRLR